MVLDLRIEEFGTDEPVKTSSGQYVFVEFQISAPIKKWGGLFKKRTLFGEFLTFIVCTEGIKSNPDKVIMVDELFTKRLVVSEITIDKIREYVQRKVDEAGQNASTPLEAFDYLEKYFVIDD